MGVRAASYRTRFVSIFLSGLLGATAGTLSAQTDRLEERLALAEGLIQRGMHDDAARQLQSFLREGDKHPRAAEALYRLGTCYLQLKKPKDAVASFEQALTKGRFGLRAECRYRLGQELKKSNSLPGAVDQFERLLAEEGDKHYLAPAAHYSRGECLRDQGNGKAALKSFLRAAEIENSSTNKDAKKAGRFGMPGLYQAGFLHLRAGRNNEAETVFQRAADRYPNHAAGAECRFLQGEAAYRGGHLDRATRAYRQAVQKGGDKGQHTDDALFGLGLCARDQKLADEAIAWFRSCAQKFPASDLAPRARIEEARLLRNKDQARQAVAALDEVLKHKSTTKSARCVALELRGLSHWDGDNKDAADRDLVNALTLATGADAARLHYHRGQLAAENTRWKAAHASFEKASAIPECDPDLLGDALYGQMLALHRMGRFKDSNTVAVTFAKRCPKHRLQVTVLFAKAENHFAQREYQSAWNGYSAVPAKHELRRMADFKRAWACYLANQHDQAAKVFLPLAKGADDIAEESLAMATLALFQAKNTDQALRNADLYRARHPQGRFLARCERIAARVLKQRGKLTAAAKRLANAAAAKGGGATDILEQADVLFQKGDFEGARKIYADVGSRKDATGSRALLGLAWCAFELGNQEDCRRFVDDGLKHPAIAKETKAELLELLAAVCHKNRDWKGAVQAGRTFLQSFPTHERRGDMLYSFGTALSRSGKLDESGRALRQALQSKTLSKIDRAWYELAWVLRRNKKESEALSAFRKVTATSKDKDLVGEAWLHVGEAALRNKEQRAVALASLSKVSGKHRARALYRIGFAKLEKNPAQALEAFEEIRAAGEKHAMHAEASYLAGECLRKMGQHTKAAARYRDALKKPDHERAQQARLQLGDCELQSGGAQRAAPVLMEYLRRCPKDNKLERARGYLLLGRARQAMNQHDDAEAQFVQTTRLCDNELAAEAQFRIGDCRRAKGKLEAAADAYVALSILYGHAEWVTRGLLAAGDCYRESKDVTKAVKFYRELIQRHPKSKAAEVAKSHLSELRRR